MNCRWCGERTVGKLLYCYDCWKYISMDIESPYTKTDLYVMNVHELKGRF